MKRRRQQRLRRIRGGGNEYGRSDFKCLSEKYLGLPSFLSLFLSPELTRLTGLQSSNPSIVAVLLLHMNSPFPVSSPPPLYAS